MPAFVLGLSLLIAMLLAGCSLPPSSPTSDATGNGVPIGQQEIANATYVGIWRAPVTLHDGRWEGPPFVAGGASRPRIGLMDAPLLQGDLDGDGRDEAVVLLWRDEGASGTWIHLAVLARQNGGVVNLASTDIGDRVQVRAARIGEQQIRLQTIQAGPNDPACCPGEKMQRRWVLADIDGGAALRELPARAEGRLSLADLGGVTWQLDGATGRPITLRFHGQRLSGHAGCNRYQALVSAGRLPGDLHISGLALTRKACAPDIMAQEAAYLARLTRTVSFAFRPQRLLLGVRKDGGGSERLIFIAQPPHEEDAHAQQR